MPGLALRMLRANKILRITKYLIKGGFSSQGDAVGESSAFTCVLLSTGGIFWVRDPACVHFSVLGPIRPRPV